MKVFNIVLTSSIVEVRLVSSFPLTPGNKGHHDNLEFEQILISYCNHDAGTFRMGILQESFKAESCFGQGVNSCSSTICAAHSIQTNGILSQLEDETIAGNKIYSLEECLYNNNNQIIDYKLIGKISASVLRGFCDRHDIELFFPIEQETLNLSDRLLFLFYYMGFAHSHHNLAKQYKFGEYVLQNGKPDLRSQETLADHLRFKAENSVMSIFYTLGIPI